MHNGSIDTSYLLGLRVLEVGDEHSEYAGKLLAELGADVIKVEPLTGERTRAYGPFFQDQPDPNRSLYFWQYNRGKRGVTLDLDTPAGQAQFRNMAAHAEVILDGRPNGYLESRGLGFESLRALNPSLIFGKISAFGEDGPWANYTGSDLVHLALGGMAMNSGYDPDPRGDYDTPPIAPQMWQAYHVAGEHMVFGVLAAAHHRNESGQGQRLSVSVHQANATCTESDMPMWVALRTPYVRQTGRHASPILTVRTLSRTKDGRYVMPYTTYVKNFPDSWPLDIATLREYGMSRDLEGDEWEDAGYRVANAGRIADAMDKLIARTTFDSGLWEEMLAKGLTWAPVRRPEENLTDAHWHDRHTFHEVEHPELGTSFTYTGARWVSDQANWQLDQRAPLVGEHNSDCDWLVTPAPVTNVATSAAKRLPLEGIRVVDLSWMLASAGAGRYLAAMGAEVIKVEHMSRLDGMRFAGMPYPDRAVRDAATEPVPYPTQKSINQSANFNEINTGKLAISLNLKDDRGRAILEDLIRNADLVFEGYSPGTMDRMGLGYDRLRELNPNIIYVQQSGLGQRGRYGGAKAFGPTAQAFSGLTEMSGYPEPWAPAGIGYSYLDWFGAYNMATAALAALYRRDRTGQGCWIDSSQVEMGIYLQGTALLDYTVNGREWQRYGNRSPYKLAAPHGIYPSAGRDRWIAIAAFDEAQWSALVEALGSPDWASDAKFATLSARLEHQDELDMHVAETTRTLDRYELMTQLQARGVPAGVAQDAQDRVENDVALAAANWLVELPHSEFGSWPAKDVPVSFSETPLDLGGIRGRHSPCYGEDTDHVLSEVLGFTSDEITTLHREKVL